MQMIADSYRGISLVVDLTLDRIMVPLAIAVALAGACLIGIQLAEMTLPEPAGQHQL